MTGRFLVVVAAKATAMVWSLRPSGFARAFGREEGRYAAGFQRPKAEGGAEKSRLMAKKRTSAAEAALQTGQLRHG